MQSLYPLLINPEYVERVWGTKNLGPFYDQAVSGAPIGEVWLTGDRCTVRNGALAGKTLQALAKQYGEAFLGAAATNVSRFPLLLKVLYPKEKLSVQVHPDDAMASTCGEDCGKTECWYVLCAEPGAQVAIGLKPGVSSADVKQAIQENRLEALLNWLTVSPGELLYIEAGTIHAIAPGSILLETQQNSDTTDRLYDYGRPRELHIDKGLEAFKPQACAGKIAPAHRNEHKNLIDSPCFVVNHYTISKRVALHTVPSDGNSSVHCIFMSEGSGTLEVPGAEMIELQRGDAALVPACIGEYAIRASGVAGMEFLCAHLPAIETEHPHARATLHEQALHS